MTSSSAGLLDTVGATLDVALSGRGFPPGQRADAGDALVRRWIRKLPWKRDIVDVVYRRGRTQLHVGVSVEIPIGDRHISIDGTNAGYLAGRSDGYDLPRGWFIRWKRQRFVERIDRDVRNAVDWFEQYDSPRHALDKLQSSDRNGCRVESDAHRAIVTFLESRRSAHYSRRELLDAFTLLVPRVFGPLAERHALRVREIEAGPLVLETETRCIRARFGSGHRPDFTVALEGLANNQVFQSQRIATPEDIQRELENAARLVEQWCTSI